MTFAVLCPGQGAQHSGMLDVSSSDDAAAEVLATAATALGDDLRAWLVDPESLFENVKAQPLICASQLAWWAALRGRVPVPVAFAGYSVGELAAYGVADALDIEALVLLAHERAVLMDGAAGAEPGGVIALRGLSRAAVVELCSAKGAFIAIANADDAYVIGGTQVALDSVAEAAVRCSGQVTCLRVGIASHTPLLAAAAIGFRAALEASSLRSPARPVVAGIDGSWVITRERAIGALSAQLACTVEWSRCLDALRERGCRVFLEVGPGAALSKMVRDRFDNVEARSVDEFRDPLAVAAWVQRSVDRMAS